MSKVTLIPELRFPEFKNEGEWKNKPLDDLCKLVRGPFGGALKKEIFVQKGYAVYEQSHAIYSDFNSFRYRIGEEKYFELKRFSVRASDLIMSCSGTMGKFAIIPKNYELGIINQALLKLTIKKDFDIWFVKISLETEHNQNKLLSQSAGGAIKNVVSVSQIKELELAVPKLPEQQKIASCLSSLDEVIASNSQKLDLLKDHKKGLMQNLFPQEGEKVPKYRFKEFEKDGEWVSHKIGDFIESHKGGAPLTPSDFVDKSDFEVIPKKAINEGGLLNMSVTSPTYCTEIFYDNNKKSVVDSSFLITTLRDLVPSGPSIGYIVKFNGIKKYILAQGVYGLKPKNTIVPDFLTQFSNTIRYRKLVNAAMVGSTQVHIRNSEFLNLPIQAPKKQEQQKIASCLSSLDALITAKTEKIEQLKLHKKGLMQGLFPKIND